MYSIKLPFFFGYLPLTAILITKRKRGPTAGGGGGGAIKENASHNQNEPFIYI